MQEATRDQKDDDLRARQTSARRLYRRPGGLVKPAKNCRPY
jgi:hypothetical protein